MIIMYKFNLYILISLLAWSLLVKKKHKTILRNFRIMTPFHWYFTIFQDVNREVDQIRFDLQDMERWRDRFFQAIHTGSVINVSKLCLRLGEL